MKAFPGSVTRVCRLYQTEILRKDEEMMEKSRKSNPLYKKILKELQEL